MNTYKLWILEGTEDIVLACDGINWLHSIQTIRLKYPDACVYRVAEMTPLGLDVKFGPDLLTDGLQQYYGC